MARASRALASSMSCQVVSHLYSPQPFALGLLENRFSWRSSGHDEVSVSSAFRGHCHAQVPGRTPGRACERRRGALSPRLRFGCASSAN